MMNGATIKTLFAHGLLTPLCHLFCECLFSVLADVSDAGRTVATEDKSEELAYQIVVKPTFLYVGLAFCTGMEALLLATSANLAP